MSDKASKTRKLISGANAVVVIAAVIGIAVALNAISSQVFARADLTENQLYTLSEASEQAVSDLDEPIRVKAFISPDLPPPMHNLTQTVSDTLEEYAAASDGKLTYEIISPTDDQNIEEDANSYGCQKVAVSKRSENERTLRAVYKCVSFSRGDDLEVVEDLQVGRGGMAHFEYEFTKAILNLRDPEPRKIGFVSGFGGPADSPQFLQSIQPVFEQLYGELIAVTTVDLSKEQAELPEDVSALVVLNASKPFSEEAIFVLDQFVQSGGSVGWFQSATGVDRRLQQQMMQQMPNRRPPQVRTPLESGLVPVFKEYGLELRGDIVLDPENGVTSLAFTQHGLAQITQPATFTMQNIDRSLPFSRDFSLLALPAPATIQVQPWVDDDDSVDVHRVVQTAESARRHTDVPRSFDYESLSERAKAGERGKWTVAAALQGDVRSYYESNPLPEGRSEQELVDQANPARVLVIGNGEFFQPLPQVGFNEKLASLGGQFFLSSLEWLVQDNALTQIRSKAMPRLLGDVPQETRRSIQFINIAAVPAVFAMIGALMMMRRRRRKESIARQNQREQ